MKKKIGLALSLVAVLFLLKTLNDAGVFRTVTPKNGEACRKVDGAVGAEDVERDPVTGLVIISSQERRAWMAGQPTPGGLFTWNPAEPTAAPKPLTLDFTGEFHPHGLSLLQLPDGTRRLFVVNHPTTRTSSIELFDLVDAESGLAVKHVRTVTAPEFISLNDVAAVGPEQFYATNDAGTVNETAGRVAETFLQLPWASVVYFDGQHATRVAKGFKYANGIIVSRDGKTVFVSESTGQRRFAYARDVQTGELTKLAEQVMAIAMDNFAYDADGALWIGAHPKLLAFLAHAKDAKERSPSIALRATWDAQSKQFTATEAWVDDGSTLSGSSVALPLGGGHVLIGSVFEQHLLDCALPTAMR